VGGAVNDSENVGVSLRDRERANQINMGEKIDRQE
jgi:hypothetical protein